MAKDVGKDMGNNKGKSIGTDAGIDTGINTGINIGINIGIEEELTRNIFIKRENDIKHPTYEKEMEFYRLVSQGREEELREFRKGKPAFDSPERGTLSKNPLRNAVYHFVVMATMLTRLCIEAGLDHDVAYEMSDLYINKADLATTRDEVYAYHEEMIYGFTRKMAENSHRNVYSKQIILCIDYISQNLHDIISVADLAKYVGLNETYLSKLFKKEMGESISEYIRIKKVEAAKTLLQYSDKSSIEIATDLGFSSHSYFISVFKKTTGVTPREYRNNKFRKTLEG